MQEEQTRTLKSLLNEICLVSICLLIGMVPMLDYHWYSNGSNVRHSKELQHLFSLSSVATSLEFSFVFVLISLFDYEFSSRSTNAFV
jgi:hypothetical protein